MSIKPSEIAEVFAFLVGAYPDYPVTSQSANVYAEMLADYPASDVWRAAREHVAESKYFPKANELRQRVAKRAAGCPDADQAWSEAWSQAPKAQIRTFTRFLEGELVQCCGEHWRPVAKCPDLHGPRVSHPAIAEAVAGLGGWGAVNATTPENLHAVRAQFRVAYESAVARAHRTANVGRLEAHQAGNLLTEGD